MMLYPSTHSIPSSCSTNSKQSSRAKVATTPKGRTHFLAKVIHLFRLDRLLTRMIQDATHEDLARGLQEVVHRSGNTDDVSDTIHGETGTISSHPWLKEFIPGLHKWESSHHVGNFVAIRGTDDKIFETMPIYARYFLSHPFSMISISSRIGMHLLFYGKHQIEFLENRTVEEHLKEMSIKVGILFSRLSPV